MNPGEPLRTSSVIAIERARPLALVGLGGSVGSLVRHLTLSTSWDPMLVVFVLNIAGSFALGALTAWLHHDGPTTSRHLSFATPQQWTAVLGLGLCGGLTTFSTHMVDVAQRIEVSPLAALVSLLGTAAVAIGAAALGYRAMLRMFTAATPKPEASR